MGFKIFYEKLSSTLKGGKGDSLSLKDIPELTLKIGTEIEYEHTTKREVAQDIVKDHIVEDPHYYQKLLSKVEPDEIPKIAKKAGITKKEIWDWIGEALG